MAQDVIIKEKGGQLVAHPIDRPQDAARRDAGERVAISAGWVTNDPVLDVTGKLGDGFPWAIVGSPGPLMQKTPLHVVHRDYGICAGTYPIGI